MRDSVINMITYEDVLIFFKASMLEFLDFRAHKIRSVSDIKLSGEDEELPQSTEDYEKHNLFYKNILRQQVNII